MGKAGHPTPHQDSRIKLLVYESLGATCRRLAQYSVRESRLIISAKHLLVGRLITSAANPHTIRIAIWVSLLRSLMYLGIRNRPYCTPYLDIIRGKSHPSCIRGVVPDKPHCCDDSGGIVKIRRYLNTLYEEEREAWSVKLDVRLGKAISTYNRKGHCGNGEAEGLLRECAAPPLKRPFRSVMIRTPQREQGIKLANDGQRKFYRDFQVRFYGSPGIGI